MIIENRTQFLQSEKSLNINEVEGFRGSGSGSGHGSGSGSRSGSGHGSMSSRMGSMSSRSGSMGSRSPNYYRSGSKGRYVTHGHSSYTYPNRNSYVSGYGGIWGLWDFPSWSWNPFYDPWYYYYLYPRYYYDFYDDAYN